MGGAPIGRTKDQLFNPHHLRAVQVRPTFLRTGLDVPVHPQNVLGNHTISLFVGIIGYDKEQIETGEQRVRKGNVPVGILVHIVLDSHQ